MLLWISLATIIVSGKPVIALVWLLCFSAHFFETLSYMPSLLSLVSFHRPYNQHIWTFSNVGPLSSCSFALSLSHFGKDTLALKTLESAKISTEGHKNLWIGKCNPQLQGVIFIGVSCDWNWKCSATTVKYRYVCVRHLPYIMISQIPPTAGGNWSFWQAESKITLSRTPWKSYFNYSQVTTAARGYA